MARDAILNITITKKLKNKLYAVAEEKRMRIGSLVDDILFDACSRYKNVTIDFRTAQRYSDNDNKELLTMRCELDLKKMLSAYSERDTGGDMSIAFQMIAANFLNRNDEK